MVGVVSLDVTCYGSHVEHHSEVIVAVTSLADRCRKPPKPIALVEGDCDGHFRHRLNITPLKTKGPCGFEAGIQESSSDAAAAVL